MAKKVYIGAGNVAHNVAGIYVGVNNIARMVKKAYIGIGGVARPCWRGGKLSYYGAITPLSLARYMIAAAVAGRYAIFGGGYDGESGDPHSALVEAYDKSLVRILPSPFTTTRGGAVATSIGGHALFCGGNHEYDYTASVRRDVEVYDSSLTRKNPINAQYQRYWSSATAVGNYALFCGGTTRPSSSSAHAYVTAIDKSLSVISAPDLSYARCALAATTVGGYALCGGGTSKSGNYSAIDAYDTALTRTLPGKLQNAAKNLAAATVGRYAIFSCGSASRTDFTVLDQDLVRQIITSPCRHYESITSASMTEYALFHGSDQSDQMRMVTAFDTDLVATSMRPENGISRFAAGVGFGDYALFAGGFDSNNKNYTSAVDVYVA